MHRSALSFSFAASLALAVCSLPAAAQSVYVLDMSSGSADVVEYSMITGACSPASAVMSTFPVLTAGPGCPTAGPVAGMAGDIAVDSDDDEIWVTDGSVLTGYTTTGVATTSLQFISGYLPMPMAGLGMDSVSSPNRLFATDGTDAVGFYPPGGCAAAGFSVAFPGTIPTPTGAFVTDIDYDPKTDSLWACDLDGFVTNFDTSSGVLLNVPFFVGLGLQGIAVDDTSGNLLISDGTVVLHYLPSGTPAAASFHAPGPGFPLPLTSMRGLAFAAHPLRYGDASGGTTPSIGADGQCYSGNASFTTTIEGAAPGATCFLYRSNAPLCPSFPLTSLALPLNILPTVFLVGSTSASIGGAGGLSTPLPVLPCGMEVYLQWLCVSTTLEVSDSLGLAISEL